MDGQRKGTGIFSPLLSTIFSTFEHFLESLKYTTSKFQKITVITFLDGSYWKRLKRRKEESVPFYTPEPCYGKGSSVVIIPAVSLFGKRFLIEECLQKSRDALRQPLDELYWLNMALPANPACLNFQWSESKINYITYFEQNTENKLFDINENVSEYIYIYYTSICGGKFIVFKDSIDTYLYIFEKNNSRRKYVIVIDGDNFLFGNSAYDRFSTWKIPKQNIEKYLFDIDENTSEYMSTCEEKFIVFKDNIDRYLYIFKNNIDRHLYIFEKNNLRRKYVFVIDGRYNYGDNCLLGNGTYDGFPTGIIYSKHKPKNIHNYKPDIIYITHTMSIKNKKYKTENEYSDFCNVEMNFTTYGVKNDFSGYKADFKYDGYKVKIKHNKSKIKIQVHDVQRPKTCGENLTACLIYVCGCEKCLTKVSRLKFEFKKMGISDIIDFKDSLFPGKTDIQNIVDILEKSSLNIVYITSHDLSYEMKFVMNLAVRSVLLCHQKHILNVLDMEGDRPLEIPKLLRPFRTWVFKNDSSANNICDKSFQEETFDPETLAVSVCMVPHSKSVVHIIYDEVTEPSQTVIDDTKENISKYYRNFKIVENDDEIPAGHPFYFSLSELLWKDRVFIFIVSDCGISADLDFQLKQVYLSTSLRKCSVDKFIILAKDKSYFHPLLHPFILTTEAFL